MKDELFIKVFVAYFFGLIGGAIIFAIEKENMVLKYHAAQSLAWSIIYLSIIFICNFIPFASVFSFALFILNVLITIKGIISGSKNEEYRFPVICELADAFCK